MILIAFGSNLHSRYGAPDETVLAAVDELRKRDIEITRISSLYKTAPVPASDQPLYCNAAAVVETDLSPEDLLAVLQEIEADFGRIRKTRNEARVLDLDILAYHNKVVETETLQIPHPCMHLREFVLEPLAEIAPDWVHPVTNLSISVSLSILKNDKMKNAAA